MTTLAELMKRDDVTATWFWTHEVSTGPYSEYEVWDVVFVRDTHEPQLWVTDGDTRRTVYFQGINGCQADSRRETGGRRREPDLADVLNSLLSDAMDADNSPTFSEWFHNQYNVTGRTAPELIAEYEQITKIRDDLRAWLGDAYDEYQSADRD